MLTSQEIAQIVEQAMMRSGRVDSEGAEESNIEKWCAHFVDTYFHNDYELANYVKRNDTSTAMFSQQLEALIAKTYDKKYPTLKARNFIPAGQSIPNGAETVSSIGYDYQGEATILSNYREDVRKVELDGKKSTRNIVGIGAAWQIDIQQARAATMAGVALNSKGLMAARRLIENKIDALLTVGDSDLGIDGFAALTTGSTGVYIENKTGDLTGDWLTATAANVLADLDICMANFSGADIWKPTDMLVPSTLYPILRSTQLSTGSDYNLLRWIEEQYELKVSAWSKLNTADSAGTAGRVIIYAKDEEVVNSIISQEPEQLPSVWKGLGWETIMHARCGGVRVENPKGILYADYSV